MIKFRHKKTGKIATKSSEDSSFLLDDYSIPGWAIENSFEWEEVKTDIEVKNYNYEILSFYAQSIGGVVNEEYVWLPYSHGNGWSRLGHITKPYSTEEILSNKHYAIHSVKCLINNDTYSIGDFVETPSGQTFRITKFYLDCNKEKMLCNGTGTGAGHIGIHKLKKITKLITTEDGVDIFPGDDVVPVNADTMKIHAKTPLNNGLSIDYGNYKIFSTTEAAEEFIHVNTPCLSIADVQSVYVSAKKGYKKNGVQEEYFNKLLNIVKSKSEKNKNKETDNNSEDLKLLQIYMKGFNDELDGRVSRVNKISKFSLRAYTLGRRDALVGDDVTSVDKQTNQQILFRIKNEGSL